MTKQEAQGPEALPEVPAATPKEVYRVECQSVGAQTKCAVLKELILREYRSQRGRLP